jgi:hypothetical protein
MSYTVHPRPTRKVITNPGVRAVVAARAEKQARIPKN